MKVLLNDGLEKEGLKLFQDAGIETDTQKRDPAKLIADIAEFDALIVRSATKVTKEIIEAGAKGKLKIIGRAGVGYDNIDVAAASENGVVIKSAPYGSTNAVAELTIALMLAISRNTPQAHQSLKAGVWKKKSLKALNSLIKLWAFWAAAESGKNLRILHAAALTWKSSAMTLNPALNQA